MSQLRKQRYDMLWKYYIVLMMKLKITLPHYF